jgi:hypothetical protein
LLSLAALAALVAGRHAVPEGFNARGAWTGLALPVLGGTLVVIAGLAPAAIVEAGLASPYDQLIPTYGIVCAAAGIGWVAGRYGRLAYDRLAARRRGRWTGALAAVFACAGLGALTLTPTLGGAAQAWRSRGAFAAYAALKDRQAAMARSAGAQGRLSLTVPAVATLGDLGLFAHSDIEELGPNPHFWINADEAQYYGVGSITAAP